MTALVLLLLLAGPAVAQDVVFTPGPTTACVAAQDADDARLLCVGRAATACMERTLGGFSTVMTSTCIDREFQYWDGELNKVYQGALAEAQEIDAQGLSGPRGAPEAEAALRAMQRAWIPYRDGLCQFEQSKWGGGTGGVPAALSCLMTETARQTFILQNGFGLR
ncbi:MAG: lysozyme inhibitor LprI family protein [Pseudomonadota bacterium]